MSHIVVIKAEVRDAGAVRAACQRLRLPEPVEGTHANLTCASYFLHRAGQTCPARLFTVVCGWFPDKVSAQQGP